MKRAFVLVSFVLLVGLSLSTKAVSYWLDTPPSASKSTSKSLMAKALTGRHLLADIDDIRHQLLNSDSVDIHIPLPDGEMAVYHLSYFPIAEQALVQKFPNIRTFRGVDVSDSENLGRFDISPLGFRGMFKHNGEVVFIDPQYVGGQSIYLSYKAKEAQALSTMPGDIVLSPLASRNERKQFRTELARGNTDGAIRTYRIAVAATREYTNYFGGTVIGASSAITTAINRVGGVYESELGIRLELVGNNDAIIYTDSDPGPYRSDPLDNLTINQTNIDNVIGNGNYDIGHLFVLGTGGIATLGVVCNNDLKARGLTGLNNPVGDPFYIDFVAHEIGHQFGANHTFNGTSASCGGANRNAATALEPGSGSTIMAYAGICDDENLQGNSNAYFHAQSIAQISSYIKSESVDGRSCAEPTSPSIISPVNAVPEVDAGDPIVIPGSTPFILFPPALATDADADALSYVWEQLDAGDSSCNPATMKDNGNRAIFRSFAPTASANRYLPRYQDVLNNTTTLGETYVTTDRVMDFRLTVRDGNGAIAYDDKRVSVTSSAGPFLVTEPEMGAVWSAGFEQVTWDVANTGSGSLVNCPSVDILLSTDGGASFLTQLEMSTDNDGEETVMVPVGVSGPVRIMVRCSDSRFYAISGSVPTFVSGSAALQSCRAPTNSSGGGSAGGMLILISLLLLLARRKHMLCTK